MITTSRVRIWRRLRSNTGSAYGPASVRYIEHPSGRPKGVFLHQMNLMVRRRSHPGRPSDSKIVGGRCNQANAYRTMRSRSPFCVGGQWLIMPPIPPRGFDQRARRVVMLASRAIKKSRSVKLNCRYRRRRAPAACRTIRTSGRNVPQPRRSSDEHLAAFLGNHGAIA